MDVKRKKIAESLDMLETFKKRKEKNKINFVIVRFAHGRSARAWLFLFLSVKDLELSEKKKKNEKTKTWC